ncbi:MAG: hypothetical protein NW237_13465 [Cyanobacteriota bacterium]|nr:hypothetical protein [Cyanobacteriota bacterium]
MRLPFSAAATPARPSDHIGEVIEASSTGYTAQCFEPQDLTFPSMPALGSWVKSWDEETGHRIYGVTCHAAIAPIDSVHHTRALGLSPQELREQQPQVFAMLRTVFQVAIVAFDTGDRLYGYLPPRPPQIHQAVYRCQAQEIQRLSQETEFLRTLLQVTGIPVDELMGAVIRNCYKTLNFDREWLITVGRRLSVLLKDDYDRLSAIIRKIDV